MKRIVSLLLCLLMVVMALASCSDTTGAGSGSKAERPNQTLKMAIVVDDKTTAEGIAAMQAAFNAESEVILATRVEFTCLKESEYVARMSEIMQGVADARKNGIITPEVDGTAQGVFPKAVATQFDIVLITSEDMYLDYIQKGWITGLNTLMKTYKVLSTKMLETVREATLVNGECYGIPANKAYGEYTYVALNKAALDYYSINTADIKTLGDAYTLFSTISNANDMGRWEERFAGTDFSPIMNTDAEFLYPNVAYMSNKGATAPSLLGAWYDGTDSRGYGQWNQQTGALYVRNLLESDEYCRFLEMKALATANDYFSEDGDVENFLLGIVRGDYGVRNSNADYVYIPIELPSLKKSEVFEAMLSVSNFSVNKERAVEMIQELMTDNTRAGLLNTILFGAEEGNYEFVDGCVSFRAKSNYAVHRDFMFGNLRELAYPCADYGQTVDTYTNAYYQNTDLAKRVPLVGEDFYSDAYVGQISTEKWNAVTALCEEKYAALLACRTSAEFRALRASICDELNANADFSELVHKDVNINTKTFTTIGGAFFEYIQAKIRGN